ncbi:MAG TPA: rubredoxin [Geobacteraceae bacterium]|nr:rubredoxin [Geobacteraceae bacterium]
MSSWKHERWKCSLCHFIYDPAEGDPEHGVKAGVSFRELPPHWECPRCKSHRNLFRPVTEDDTMPV